MTITSRKMLRLSLSSHWRRHVCILFPLVFLRFLLTSEALSPFRFRAFPRYQSIEQALLTGDEDTDKYPPSGFRVNAKRSYVDLRCRGMYAPRIFAQLDRICEDCYNLYRDAEVHNMCRSGCFTTQTFRNCLQNLLLDKESEFYQELVEIIGK